jgi:hypothetical protein
MSDPFKLLMPLDGKTTTSEVRQHVVNQTLSAWMEAGVALPDLYIVDRKSHIPDPIAEDGKPLTPERFAELMKGLKPMFIPSPDGDNSKAEPTGEVYTEAFDLKIEPEELGKSAVENRPKQIRIFKPVEADLSAFKPKLEQS